MAEIKKEEEKTLSESDLEKVAGGDPQFLWCSNCNCHCYVNTKGECMNCGRQLA